MPKLHKGYSYVRLNCIYPFSLFHYFSICSTMHTYRFYCLKICQLSSCGIIINNVQKYSFDSFFPWLNGKFPIDKTRPCVSKILYSPLPEIPCFSWQISIISHMQWKTIPYILHSPLVKAH